MEEYGVDDTNEFAEERTVAHALAESKLLKVIVKESQRPQSEYIDSDMEIYMGNYVLFIQELMQDPLVMVEQRLNCT